jgi:hypothetical protein
MLYRYDGGLDQNGNLTIKDIYTAESPKKDWGGL